MSKSIDIKMQEGRKYNWYASNPIISINANGTRTYLWIGNNAKDDGYCFATLSGVKTLEKLACEISRALGHKPAQIKKIIRNQTP